MKINKEYSYITKDIINSKVFLELKNDVNHGTNKYDHCKRVSYLSYILAKIFKGNRELSAKCGLLHDFFMGTRTSCEENSYFKHPYTSAKNAKKYFNINDSEAKIIKSHMYHQALLKNILPFTTDEEKEYFKNNKLDSKESKIVRISDLLVSTYECIRYKTSYSVCLYFLFFININL